MPVKVSLSGPILTGMAPAIIQGILKDAVGDVTAKGEKDLKIMARPRPSGIFHSGSYARAHGYRQSGHYYRSIHGETTSVAAGVAMGAAGVSSGAFFSSPHGIIHDSNVIYGPWLEGVGSRNDATRFKGYAMFRRTTQQLQRESTSILQERVGKSLRRLG